MEDIFCDDIAYKIYNMAIKLNERYTWYDESKHCLEIDAEAILYNFESTWDETNYVLSIYENIKIKIKMSYFQNIKSYQGYIFEYITALSSEYIELFCEGLDYSNIEFIYDPKYFD